MFADPYYYKKSNPYVISEIGCNHNGDMDLAKKMIRSSKEFGASAIKLQLWHQHQLSTLDYLNELNEGTVKLENVDVFKTDELGLGSIFEQNEKFHIWYEEHEMLFDYCRELGIDYSSSPNDKEGIDFLIDQKCAFVKLSSMDAVNFELLEYMISKEFPLILSLGMCSLSEIDQIIRLVPKSCEKNISLLHCVSIYPPENSMINLEFIHTLKRMTDINIGYSDHSLGTAIPLAAVAMGATILEKHFTLDKNMPGWDHKVSANEEELREICEDGVKIAEAMGNGQRILSQREIEKRAKFRRSYVTAKPLKKGHKLSREDLLVKRPGTGIGPEYKQFVMGRTLAKDLEEDKTIFWEDLV